MVIYNEEYFLDDSQKIYLSQILRKIYIFKFSAHDKLTIDLRLYKSMKYLRQIIFTCIYFSALSHERLTVRSKSKLRLNLSTVDNQSNRV